MNEPLTPETSPQVISEKYVPMGGGQGGAKATLNRDGLLIIEGRSESKSKTVGTRTSVFVVGTDRHGRTLFVSNQHDVPTACSTWDPTCPSKTAQTFRENIAPETAKYIAKLDVYAGQRGNTGFQASLEQFRRNVKSVEDLKRDFGVINL